jgi:hypothetical protein
MRENTQTHLGGMDDVRNPVKGSLALVDGGCRNGTILTNTSARFEASIRRVGDRTSGIRRGDDLRVNTTLMVWDQRGTNKALAKANSASRKFFCLWKA